MAKIVKKAAKTAKAVKTTKPTKVVKEVKKAKAPKGFGISGVPTKSEVYGYLADAIANEFGDKLGVNATKVAKTAVTTLRAVMLESLNKNQKFNADALS